MQHAQRMMMTEKIAASILAREGIAAIWKHYEAAAVAHRTGHSRSAGAMLEVAEAAEEAWLSARKGLRGRVADVIASFGLSTSGQGSGKPASPPGTDPR